MLRVAFHSNQLSLRGTEVALYDYADWNEKVLGNHSLIVTPKESAFHDAKAATRFAERFKICSYKELGDLDKLLLDEQVDVLYCIKAGFNDGVVSKRCKTCVHAVFKYREEHGEVYAYVSRWLSETMSAGKLPFVPHIVSLPEESRDFRVELNIPREAVVFGRHGGAETFDLEFVRHVVYQFAKARPDTYFLFLNTDRFCDKLPNIIHLGASADLNYKVKFINSCDAMLHARASGETFGLAVAEFCLRNKPVITWSGSSERAHIDTLGSLGFYYSDAHELANHLVNFKPCNDRNWNAYQEFNDPARVMQQFKAVFLDG